MILVRPRLSPGSTIEYPFYDDADRERHARERSAAIAEGERRFPTRTAAEPAGMFTNSLSAAAAKRLSDFDLRMLRASGLTDATVAAAGLYTTSSAAEINRIAGWDLAGKTQGDALVIPCYRPGESEPYTHRLRLHHPRIKTDQKTGKRKPVKYESPADQPAAVYYGPASRSLDALRDASQPIIVCEGEKKALALEQCGFVVIGLTGIWNGTDAAARARYREQNPGLDQHTLHPDIARYVELRDREVTILFDYSERADPDEPKAARRLARVLQAEGAKVKITTPPSAAAKGADDLYVARAR